MEKIGQPFEITLNGVTMTIQEVAVPRYRAFAVVFSSKRRPITVVRATNRDGEKFWTTIPENINRQGEAEGVGKLIQEYLKTNQA